jgi:AcrR family transcriptional regulator
MEEIVQRVLELYRKYGIKSITMDDVSSELGISKKTLYQHVADKEELVRKVMDFEFKTTKACLRNVMDQGMNAIDELLEVSRFISGHLHDYSSAMEYDLRKYYPDIYKTVIQRRRDNMYHNILANMKKGKQEGIYRSDIDEEIIARMHVSRTESMTDNSMFTIEEFNEGKVFRELFVYHIRGIATEGGIRFLEENLHKLQTQKKN